MITGYRVLLASLVGERDGMAVELTRDDGTRVAEVFRDDETGRRAVTAYAQDIPLDAMTWLLEAAQAHLDGMEA